MSNRSGGTLRWTSNPCSNKLQRLSRSSALGKRPDIPTIAILTDVPDGSVGDFVSPSCSPTLTSTSVPALKAETKLDDALEGPIVEILHFSLPESLASETTAVSRWSNESGRIKILPTTCLN